MYSYRHRAGRLWRCTKLARKSAEEATLLLRAASMELCVADLCWTASSAHQRSDPQRHKVYESTAVRQLQDSEAWRHV